MSCFISELYGNRAIDNLTECSNVSGDPFRTGREDAVGTCAWQMETPAPCQRWTIPGVPHSQLSPDLRLGLELELARALVELPCFCLIPRRVSWKTCFPRPWLQRGYKWVSYTLNASESKQFLDVLKVPRLQFLRCLARGRHARQRACQMSWLRGPHFDCGVERHHLHGEMRMDSPQNARTSKVFTADPPINTFH